jgi:hydroxymethylbilane synthase
VTKEERTLVIGTRSSALAMWQTDTVSGLLPGPVKVQKITTSGDRFREISLQGGSQTGFFTKEIEDRLLAGDVDVAVHSLKDLPTQIADGLTIPACLPRAPVADLLLVHPDWHAPDRMLPIKPGCRVGAGSLRRQALIRLYAPDTTPELIRGNVPTRANKCKTLEYGAIVLARAGVERLGLDLSPLHVYELNPEHWLPAPGQGAVAVQVRKDDSEAIATVTTINHAGTTNAVDLERALLSSFEGGCHTAFGAHAIFAGGTWTVAIGIDRGEEGWGQRSYTGSAQELRRLGPAEVPSFSAPSPAGQEDLCRPYLP